MFYFTDDDQLLTELLDREKRLILEQGKLLATVNELDRRYNRSFFQESKDARRDEWEEAHRRYEAVGEELKAVQNAIRASRQELA